ncbi:MAG: T9SS type A sorting domain-containing protein [Saprospiraceae bacterium]|nr:T9SS type A sorting domain-containing protein [Saprospiraceae bacterium]MCF8250878.1 T9SS type A sorting domain-containing protein [Saprospiraceae bacterium]MCF8281134.1 T9SS type A sorting domain-containing protein [Bacteroidales bacterium]MCF8312721.1 T9SS type A sorting domain-containing protein [Saprospiraceae bacterium]MCF8441168.1 T9SS type A sorting domain-containing protein [Saprospiraceae bacterium]
MKSHTTSAILFFIFIATNQLIGQPLFAPLGAVWYYDQYNCPPGPSISPYVLTVTEDSIINGKYCTKLPNNFCHSDASCSSDVYVHQDGSKVFVYEPSFNGFQMLYDFSLQTGDSYTYIMCKESWGVDTVTIHVDYADTDPAGMQHLGVVPNQPTWWSDFSAVIVKGIGGTTGQNRLLFTDYCVLVDCPSWAFRCYQTPSSGSYPPGCVSAVEVGDLPSDGVLLYPNPAYDYLHIELKAQKPMKRASFRIVDSGGRLVREFEAGNLDNPSIVPVRDWVAGMYFLQYLEGGEVKTVEKFIITKQ